MNQEKQQISFIIPAKNEEGNITETISSITNLHLSFKYEVIVIDHNSSDSTGFVAKGLGAQVIRHVGGTIGSVRNIGAAAANGSILVFIDADVSLTESWKEFSNQLIKQISNHENFITGSHCSAPSNGTWLESYWFNNFSQDVHTTHLGTGHLIVSKSFFDMVGGFDESLVTGEDYEFCVRAKNNGATLQNNQNLKVIHRDFPKSLKEFIKREAWHGLGDSGSFSAVLNSKVAIMAVLFMVVHLFGFFAAIAWGKLGVLAFLFLIAGQVAISSLYKYGGKSIKVILVNSIIFYFYYVGRSLSIIKSLFNK